MSKIDLGLATIQEMLDSTSKVVKNREALVALSAYRRATYAYTLRLADGTKLNTSTKHQFENRINETRNGLIKFESEQGVPDSILIIQQAASCGT